MQRSIFKVLLAIAALCLLAAQTVNVPQQTNVYSAERMGIDCSGKRDGTTALQNAINEIPDAGTIWFPLGCKVVLSAQINETDRSGVELRSETLVNNFGGGQTPQFIWNANGGTMFSIQHSDHPTFQGFAFTVADGKSIDRFLDFDGNPVRRIGTAGLIQYNSFSASGENNANFVAIAISATATNNQENYEVYHNQIGCSGSEASLRSRVGSIISGSSNLIATNASFVADDVGSRLRVSYPGGLLDTTITSVISPTEVVMAANATVTESNVTIHTGQSYGIGIYVGNSQNALQHRFWHNVVDHCAYGIRVVNGNADIRHLGGGYGDTGIFVGGGVVQNMAIDYYESEEDKRGIEVVGAVAPTIITNTRLSNGSQMADGFLKLGGVVILENSYLGVLPVPNSVVLVGQGRNNVVLTSIGNEWRGIPWERVGYHLITSPPVTSINDHIDDTAPAQQIFGCWVPSGKGSTCTQVNMLFGAQSGVAFQALAGSWVPNGSHHVVAVQGAGSVDFVGDFVGVQGVGTSGRSTGTQAAVEASWPAVIDARQGLSAAYGFRAMGPSAVNGRLANLYGVYVAKQSVINAISSWGIYQAYSGDTDYFSGPVIIGPSHVLKVAAGEIGLGRITASGTAPGAEGVKFGAVCGTNPGTAKIIAYAGTSTTPVTIVDNVGSGVTGC